MKRVLVFCSAVLSLIVGCRDEEKHLQEQPTVKVVKNRSVATNKIAVTRKKTEKRVFPTPPRRKIDPTKPSLKGMKPAVLRFALKGAIEKDDPTLVFKLAAKAANSEDVELRDIAVDALNWYGVDAIPELLPFMLDTDQQIINKAFDVVDLALANVPSESQRMELLEIALTHANDEDQARSLLSKCETVSPIAGIGILIDMIEKNPDSALADLCREEYEDMAGRPYRNRDEAQRMARYLKRDE